MRDKKRLPHVVIQGAPQTEQFRKPPKKIDSSEAPMPLDTRAHGEKLLAGLHGAVDSASAQRKRYTIRLDGPPPGLRIEFESPVDVRLALESLSDKPSGIELLAVNFEHVEHDGDVQIVERAVVFVPEGAVQKFVKKFEAYLGELTATGKLPHQKLVHSMDSVRHATLRSMWTDDAEEFPARDEAIWWEVWLRSTTKKKSHPEETLARFYQYAEETGMRVQDRRLHFPGRIVVLAYGTAEQLTASVYVLNDLAELRRARETAEFFVSLPQREQGLWVSDLLARTVGPPEGAPAVCILDTGVNAGHPLLGPSMALSDCLAVDPTWGVADHQGHGTEMAGIALYGDLTTPMESSSSIQLQHRLESVKILPPRGANEPELYGSIMAEAASRIEIQHPSRYRIYLMAVTAFGDAKLRGQPTSWSSAVDALAGGRTFDVSTYGLEYLDDEPFPRLIVVSAGNGASALQEAYLDRADTEMIEDPAQAWNALTVGAYTEKSIISDPDLHGHTPVSTPGDVAPWTTTGIVFETAWPNKPDIVMEGGNASACPQGFVGDCADLGLLTTCHDFQKAALRHTYATSPAAAQAARTAALIAAEYPTFWPETVRALVVHSARWTERMYEEFRAGGTKGHRGQMLRRYGYGVPSLERALYSASNAATLVFQGAIQPFRSGAYREIHLHALPWPVEALRDLGETKVTLRVTLSYFIEPNPRRQGWRGKYQYPSHGLTFQIKSPTETPAEFHRRLNAEVRPNDYQAAPPRDAAKWYLGSTARARGSLQSDYLFDVSASDLAEQNVLAVLPTTGWWKEVKEFDRSQQGARYSLVVSIEAPDVDVDLWTPIVAQVQVAAEVVVENG